MYALDQLEYYKFLDLLSTFCHSEKGKQLAKNVIPLLNRREILNRANKIKEIMEMIQIQDFSFIELHSTEELFNPIEKPIFDFSELKKIISNIRITNSITSDLSLFDPYENLKKVVAKLVSFSSIVERFTAIFDSEGKVLDSASSALRVIRNKKTKLRRTVHDTMQKAVQQYHQNNFMHDAIITQRDGRFVIPIKEGSAPFVKGIVHGKSTSKSSVYVEPEHVVGLNNSLEMVSDEERREIYRIIKEYSEQIYRNQSILITNERYLQELDFLFGTARWANRISATFPAIHQDSSLQLLGARHPLLIHHYGSKEKVIPFDVQLGDEFNILIISGPNTGGKTVTLKTVGILSLLALSGFPIPAKGGSEVGMFEHIFADIGDQQSLENALSTFSSHIKNISIMTEKGNERTLVLIDEMGAATDPEQGAALAQAILEEFIKKKSLGIITTHYTALKLYAEENESCENAAMQFDPTKHIPTYHFKLGLPGSSFAIEVASKLGFNNEIINRANELSGKQSVELANVLTKLNQEKIDLSRQLYQYQLKTSLLNQKITEYEAKISQMEIEEKEIRKKAKKDARDYLTTIQNEMTHELQKIKKADKEKRKQTIEQSLHETQKRSKILSKEIRSFSKSDRTSISDPHIGQKVWLEDMETEGEIVEIAQDYIKVDLNGIFFTTQWNQIYRVNKKECSPKKKKVTIASLPTKQAKIELKILGYRFDDALPLIRDFLDTAEYQGLEMVRIVHGKGTGALRAKVRKYLHSQKKSFFTPAPEAGGDGVTVVELNK